jgi:hypothetical protein
MVVVKTAKAGKRCKINSFSGRQSKSECRDVLSSAKRRHMPLVKGERQETPQNGRTQLKQRVKLIHTSQEQHETVNLRVDNSLSSVPKSPRLVAPSRRMPQPCCWALLLSYMRVSGTLVLVKTAKEREMKKMK